MSKTTKRTTTKKTVSVLAAKQEQGRRRNNKGRDVKVRPKSWLLGGMTGPQLEAVINGESVTVEFKNRDVLVNA